MLLICFSHFYSWESLLKVYFWKNSQETQAKKGPWTHFSPKLIEIFCISFKSFFYQLIPFYYYIKHYQWKVFWQNHGLFWLLVISFPFFMNAKCFEARSPKINQAKNILFKVSWILFYTRFHWGKSRGKGYKGIWSVKLITSRKAFFKMPCENEKSVWNRLDFVGLFLKDTKILLECYNNYDDFIIFCFEALEGTVDNEPVNIVVIPDKFDNGQSNLCGNMMKIYRKNFLYRKISPISFFPLHYRDAFLHKGLSSNKHLKC